MGENKNKDNNNDKDQEDTNLDFNVESKGNQQSQQIQPQQFRGQSFNYSPSYQQRGREVERRKEQDGGGTLRMDFGSAADNIAKSVEQNIKRTGGIAQMYDEEYDEQGANKSGVRYGLAPSARTINNGYDNEYGDLEHDSIQDDTGSGTNLDNVGGYDDGNYLMPGQTIDPSHGSVTGKGRLGKLAHYGKAALAAKAANAWANSKAGQTAQKVRDKVDEQKEKLRDKAQELKDRAAEKAERAKDKIREAKDAAKDKLANSSAGRGVTAAGNKVKDFGTGAKNRLGNTAIGQKVGAATDSAKAAAAKASAAAAEAAKKGTELAKKAAPIVKALALGVSQADLDFMKEMITRKIDWKDMARLWEIAAKFPQGKIFINSLNSKVKAVLTKVTAGLFILIWGALCLMEPRCMFDLIGGLIELFSKPHIQAGLIVYAGTSLFLGQPTPMQQLITLKLALANPLTQSVIKLAIGALVKLLEAVPSPKRMAGKTAVPAA